MDPKSVQDLSDILYEIKSLVKCPLCLNFVRRAARLSCSHVFCSPCLEELRIKTPKKTLLCPVCMCKIARRSSVVPDLVIDETSHFANRACLRLEDTFASTVEELRFGGTIKEIVAEAPSMSSAYLNETKSIDATVERSVGQDQNSNNYESNTKSIEHGSTISIKRKVHDWMQRKHVTTPSTPPAADSEEAGKFQMPAISQVRENIRERSRSTPLDLVLPKTPDIIPNRRISIEGLSQDENIVEKIDKKVHSIFEDECLEAIEKFVEESIKDDPKYTAKEKRPAGSIRTYSRKNKKSPREKGRSSSTWARFKDDDKDKACSKKKETREKIKTTSSNKIQKESLIKAAPELESQHNSSDMEIDKTLHTSVIRERTSDNKENQPTKITNHGSEEDEDLIFQELTQRNKYVDKGSMFFVPPCGDECSDPLEIKEQLQKWMEVCRSDARELISSDHSNGWNLLNCFTHLLTYVDKLKIDKPNMKSKGLQVPEVNHRRNMCTQTKPSKHHKSVQVDLVELKESAVQTSQKSTEKSDKVSSDKSIRGYITESASFNLTPVEARESDLCIGKMTKSTDLNTVQSRGNKKKSDNCLIPSSDKLVTDISKDSCTGNSILMVSLEPSKNTEQSLKKTSATQYSRFKRIRKPPSDSESDDGQPSKKKFVRDDLSVEFVDTEHCTQNKDSSDVEDRDQYVQDFIERYDPDTRVKAKDPNNETPLQSTTITPSDTSENTTVIEVNKRRNKKRTHSDFESDPRAVQDSSHPTSLTEKILENFDRMDVEIEAFERNHNKQNQQTFTDSSIFNSEFDIVENTPDVDRSKPLDSKSKKPLEILRKGPTLSANCQMLDSSTIPNFFSDKEASPVNTTSRRKTVDEDEEARAMLNDLCNNKEFFNTDFDQEENQDTADKTTFSQTVIEVQTQLKEVLQNIDDFNLISTEEHEDSAELQVLENALIHRAEVEEGDDDGEDLIESTPQKKKDTSRPLRITPLRNLSVITEEIDVENIVLPPPTGFRDENEIVSPEEANESSQRAPMDIGSLTPDGFTDFLVTPDDQPHSSLAANSERKEVFPSPSLSQTESFIPPITKLPDTNTQKNTTYTPLVTSRFTDFLVTPDDQPHTSLRGHSERSLPPKELFPSPSFPQTPTRKSEESFISPIIKLPYPNTQKNATYTPLVTSSRQSSRKSNIMTSTPQQTSILNFLAPSPSTSSSPLIRSQKSKPCITWSRIQNSDINVFLSLEQKKLVTISKTFNKSVTHLVVEVNEEGRFETPTAKLLLAISAGIWVVSLKWARLCLKYERIISEDRYEAADQSGIPGPHVSRQAGPEERLFKNFRMYCAPPIYGLGISVLEEILRMSGAIVVSNVTDFEARDGKINLILAEVSNGDDDCINTDNEYLYEEWLTKYNVVTVEISWITMCITQYKLSSFCSHVLCVDEAILPTLGYPDELISPVTPTLSQ